MATSVRDTEIGEVDETPLEYELIMFIEQERLVLAVEEWLRKRRWMALRSFIGAIAGMFLFLAVTYSPPIDIIWSPLFGAFLLTATASLLIVFGFHCPYTKELAQVTKRYKLLQVWSQERKARMKAVHIARIMMEMLERNRSPESGNPDSHLLGTSETNISS